MIGKVRKSLVAVDADPPAIQRVAAAYRRAFPGMALTPTALEKHWPSLVTPSAPAVPATTLGRSLGAANQWVLGDDGVARPMRPA
jgi:hypothetical protein